MQKTIAFLVSLIFLVPSVLAQDARPSLYQPSINPDGSEIAFVSGGDIWTVDSSGGTAQLLISHQADESSPLYSPDGSQIAFVSNRGAESPEGGLRRVDRRVPISHGLPTATHEHQPWWRREARLGQGLNGFEGRAAHETQALFQWRRPEP